MNEAIQTLRDCGLHIKPGSTPVEVTSVLMKAKKDDLWNAFDKLCGDGPIGFNADGTIQKVTIAYTLAHAVENNLDSIDQESVYTALEKAIELYTTINNPISGPEEPVKKRTRTPELRTEMRQYIEDNPKATKKDVIDEFLNRYPEKAINTLGQYYHGCRKKAGLKPNGTPGRKKGDTFDIVQTIVAEITQDIPNVSVSELKEAVLNHPDIDLSPSSAQVYVYRARSNIQTN